MKEFVQEEWCKEEEVHEIPRTFKTGRGHWCHPNTCPAYEGGCALHGRRGDDDEGSLNQIRPICGECLKLHGPKPFQVGGEMIKFEGGYHIDQWVDDTVAVAFMPRQVFNEFVYEKPDQPKLIIDSKLVNGNVEECVDFDKINNPFAAPICATDNLGVEQDEPTKRMERQLLLLSQYEKGRFRVRYPLALTPFEFYPHLPPLSGVFTAHWGGESLRELQGKEKCALNCILAQPNWFSKPAFNKVSLLGCAHSLHAAKSPMLPLSCAKVHPLASRACSGVKAPLRRICPVRKHEMESDDESTNLVPKRLRIGWMEESNGSEHESEESMALVMTPDQSGALGAYGNDGKWWSQEEWQIWAMNEVPNQPRLLDGKGCSVTHSEDMGIAVIEPGVPPSEEPKIPNPQVQNHPDGEMDLIWTHFQQLEVVLAQQVTEIQQLKEAHERSFVGPLLEVGMIKETLQEITQELKDTQTQNAKSIMDMQSEIDANHQGICQIQEEIPKWVHEELYKIKELLHGLVKWSTEKEMNLMELRKENAELREMCCELKEAVRQEQFFHAAAVDSLGKNQEIMEQKMGNEINRLAEEIQEDSGKERQELEDWKKQVEHEICNEAQQLSQVETNQRQLIQGIHEKMVAVEGLTPTLHHVIEGMQSLQVDVEKVKAKGEISHVPPVVVITPSIPVATSNLPPETSTMLYASHDLNTRMYEKIWRTTKPTVAPQSSANPSLVPLQKKSEGIGNRDTPKMSANPSPSVSSLNSLPTKGKGVPGKGATFSGVKGGRGLPQSLKSKSSDQPNYESTDPLKVWDDEILPPRKANVIIQSKLQIASPTQVRPVSHRTGSENPIDRIAAGQIMGQMLSSLPRPNFSGKSQDWHAFKMQWEEWHRRMVSVMGDTFVEMELGYLKESLDPLNRLVLQAKEEENPQLTARQFLLELKCSYERDAQKNHRVQWENVRLRWMGRITWDDWRKFRAEFELYRNRVNNWTVEEERRLLLTQLPSSFAHKVHDREEEKSANNFQLEIEKTHGLSEGRIFRLLEDIWVPMEGTDTTWIMESIQDNQKMWIINCHNAHLRDVLNSWDGLDYRGSKLILHPHEEKMTTQEIFEMVERKIRSEEAFEGSRRKGDESPRRREWSRVMKVEKESRQGSDRSSSPRKRQRSPVGSKIATKGGFRKEMVRPVKPSTCTGPFDAPEPIPTKSWWCAPNWPKGQQGKGNAWKAKPPWMDVSWKSSGKDAYLPYRATQESWGKGGNKGLATGSGGKWCNFCHSKGWNYFHRPEDCWYHNGGGRWPQSNQREVGTQMCD